MLIRSSTAGGIQSLENFVSKQKVQSNGSAAVKGDENGNQSNENLWIDSKSYAVMISTEAKLMVMAKKGDHGTLIVDSAKDKEQLLFALGKGSGKTVNQDLKKFCIENGIDTNLSREELETYML